MSLPKHLLIGRNERPISRQEEVMWDLMTGKREVRNEEGQSCKDTERSKMNSQC